MPHVPKLAHILDEDPDLALGLGGARQATARRRAVAPVVHLGPGTVDLLGAYGSASGWLGLLLLDGLILQHARVLDHASTEVLMAGDLFCPWEIANEAAVLPTTVTYEVLADTRVALLDDAFAERVRPWGEIASALIGRADRRAHSLAGRGLLTYPRVDVRIVALLWQLAGRSGFAVADDTVVLPVRLTHGTIARIVGCDRSSVSSALGNLRRDGLITADGAGWILNGTLSLQVEFLRTRASRRRLAVVPGGAPRSRVRSFRSRSTG